LKAPIPLDEAERLQALRDLEILDTPPEPAFDDLTLLAAQICDTPMAMVSLVDEKRQWFKSKYGTSTSETARDAAFCAHTILHSDEVLEVRDATADPRFASSTLVTGDPHARFYAGAPLVDTEGYALGALCVLDRRPRSLRPEQLAALRALSRNVMAQFELRRSARRLADQMRSRESVENELRQRNQQLESSKEEMAGLLTLAEKSRRALLSVLEDEQRASHELSRTNRALKMLSSCNEALMWARDEPGLLKQVCKLAVDLGGYRVAFVAYAQDDADKTILPMAEHGDESGFLADTSLSWAADRPTGLGPAGRCIRGGEPVVCRDINHAGEAPEFAAALKRGLTSVVCLPLRDATRTFGTFVLYSAESRDLAAPEVKLLQDLADDLAFGIGALRQRTTREQAEAALVSSLNEKEALLKEIHHRVKNNLQVITSLLRLEGRRIDHAITRSVLKEMQGRIQSMALLHESLYRSGNFAKVDLAAYLTQLVDQIRRSQASQPDAVRLSIDLAQVQLEIDQAIPCGLIANELVSNSLKHGFADGRKGEIWISLRPTGKERQLKLSVRDSGIGIPKGFDWTHRKSLGLQLVSDLARQLHGELTVGPGPEALFEVIFVPTTAHLSEGSRLSQERLAQRERRTE
jgi:two-component sensor histidine kinase